jgi:hypothetical protein
MMFQFSAMIAAASLSSPVALAALAASLLGPVLWWRKSVQQFAGAEAALGGRLTWAMMPQANAPPRTKGERI